MSDARIGARVESITACGILTVSRQSEYYCDFQIVHVESDIIDAWGSVSNDGCLNVALDDGGHHFCEAADIDNFARALKTAMQIAHDLLGDKAQFERPVL